MSSSIQRGGYWWHQAPDGTWLRWNKQGAEWEVQPGPPPPPAVPGPPAQSEANSVRSEQPELQPEDPRPAFPAQPKTADPAPSPGASAPQPSRVQISPAEARREPVPQPEPVPGPEAEPVHAPRASESPQSRPVQPYATQLPPAFQRGPGGARIPAPEPTHQHQPVRPQHLPAPPPAPPAPPAAPAPPVQPVDARPAAPAPHQPPAQIPPAQIPPAPPAEPTVPPQPAAVLQEPESHNTAEEVAAVEQAAEADQREAPLGPENGPEGVANEPEVVEHEPVPLPTSHKANAPIFSTSRASLPPVLENKKVLGVAAALVILMVFGATYMGANFFFRNAYATDVQSGLASAAAEPMTKAKQAYIAKLDRICARQKGSTSRFEKQILAVDSAPEMERLFDRWSSKLKAQLDRIESIKKPKQDRRLLDRILSLQRKTLPFLERMLDAVRSQDSTALETLSAEAYAAAAKSHRLMDEYGFEVCGKV